MHRILFDFDGTLLYGHSESSLATKSTRKVTEFELSILKLVRCSNIDKKTYIVFGDSIAGVRAAVDAAIKCIGILTSTKKETLEQYGV